MASNDLPPALAALAALPQLQSQIAVAITPQARRIAERVGHFVARPTLVKALDERLAAVPAGLIALEGWPGSGTTALLCQLAATRPYAFWLPDVAADAGLEALCAQLLALYDLPVALVPPVARRDATTLERLLADAAARRTGSDPLVVLIDRLPDAQTVPAPPPFPARIPPGVVIVLACSPGERLPLDPVARIRLPNKGATLARQLVRAAIQLGCAPDLAAGIVARSAGSFLYVRLTAGLLATGLLQLNALPRGLEALHQSWWESLDAAGRRFARLLAAAGEPLSTALAAPLAGISTKALRQQLQHVYPLLEVVEQTFALYHAGTCDFISRQSSDALAGAHTRYVALARERSGGQLERLNVESDGYLVRQLARHVALSDLATRTAFGPATASRAWIRARERYTGDLIGGAGDAAWELRTAARDGPTLRLVRAAAIAGSMALLARSLPLDALVAAFSAALERGTAREATLKHVREMLDQLPDGRDKALALRRLGEVCYVHRMRIPAMRMLSEALDLEVQGLPRTWREECEEVLVALARAAVAINAPDTALGITARIVHAERRGLIETEVVRWLLAHGQRTRAEEVAYAIGHAGMHEWAMAEVAVGHMRAGDATRAEEVLGTLKTETAVAWARAELACDAARRGDAHAADRVAALTNQSLRDRSLALVALAFADDQQPAQALDVARLVEDREVRARALIDLTLRNPTTDGTALAYAAADIVALGSDERATLVAALAAAQAATGRLETGLNTAALLPAGEEYDRAQSRIAVALARIGDYAMARRIVAAIIDDDERWWALDELARLSGSAGLWRAAFDLAGMIGDAEQRTHTEADLAIAWARADDPLAARARIQQLGAPTERLRAQIAICDALVATGAHTAALATLADLHEPDGRSRYQAALVQALAEHGELAVAQQMVETIARPFERARAQTAIARAAAPQDRELAQAALGAALRATAALGRSPTFTCLEWAADTLAILGRAELLLTAADALDEVDLWWS